jgi:hypothetical protein
MNEREAFEKWFFGQYPQLKEMINNPMEYGGLAEEAKDQYATSLEGYQAALASQSEPKTLQALGKINTYEQELKREYDKGHKAALASQEPVAWTKIDDTGFVNKPYRAKANAELHYGKDNLTPLYTSPQAQPDLQDARRYRWLKSKHEVSDDDLLGMKYGKTDTCRDFTVFQKVISYGDMRELNPVPCDKGALDEAIDQAMKAKD